VDNKKDLASTQDKDHGDYSIFGFRCLGPTRSVHDRTVSDSGLLDRAGFFVFIEGEDHVQACESGPSVRSQTVSHPRLWRIRSRHPVAGRINDHGRRLGKNIGARWTDRLLHMVREKQPGW
jgi:hypothetical protein